MLSYSQIIAERGDRKTALENTASLRLMSLFEKDATFRALWQEKATIEQRIVFDGAPTTALKDVTDRINEHLRTQGISRESLFPQDICPVCHDTGYVNGRVCDCIVREWYPRALLEAGLSDYSGYSLDGDHTQLFSAVKHGAQLQKAYRDLSIYRDKFPELQNRTVVLAGETGTGKSVAAACLAIALLQRGFSVRFLTAFDMHSLFLKYHTTGLREKDAVMAPLLDVDFLVIDDLGAEPVFKNISAEYLYLLLTNRCAAKKGTLITTNLNYIERAFALKYGERIESRLMDKQFAYRIRLGGAQGVTDIRKIVITRK